MDVYLGEDLTTWTVALNYPASAPFIGGPGQALQASDFSLWAELRFDAEFPRRPPRLKFLSPWINHQHLWGTRVCHTLLSDDFMDFFHERRIHGTSLWNSSCALADGEGLGGMPRYLQVLWDFLRTDLDYEEDQHVRYDAESLKKDVQVQQSFKPPGFENLEKLESEAAAPSLDLEAEAKRRKQDEDWGMDYFLKVPLKPGNPDFHPCFDVAVVLSRVPGLTTSMASLCRRSFDEGARTTDFGSTVAVVLPFPVSRAAWEAAGCAIAREALKQLSPIAAGSYRLQLPGFEEANEELEAILGVVGELWKTTCISIVKDEGFESERAMLCFVNLHFLLLCLAEELPGLREYAARSIRTFFALVSSDPTQNLKAAVPDLGRFLVRFLLAQDGEPFERHVEALVRELLNRNVRWVDPDHWPTADASAEEKLEQVHGSFAAGQFGMKLTVFQSYYILRSKELRLDRLESLEACRGLPAPDALQVFQSDYKAIKEMEGFEEFFLWLQLDKLLEDDVHTMLCRAVEESDSRGYNGGLPWRT